MSHVPHELAADFPEHAELISQLRQQNAHFARLADAYHDVNRQVHRAETDIEPMDDLTQQGLRKQRMQLKDEICQMLREQA
ncbi:MAG: YdcH family protein [Pseudomonadota bacterium]